MALGSNDLGGSDSLLTHVLGEIIVIELASAGKTDVVFGYWFNSVTHSFSHVVIDQVLLCCTAVALCANMCNR